jgi:hypothetical protein
MSIADWLMILAVLSGPVIAVRVTRHLDERKEVRERKIWVFKTLMATRQYSISAPHVEALNRIELEFSVAQPKEKVVLEAWKEYLDHLSNRHLPLDQWGPKRVELFVEMLHKMAGALDYSFDKVHIKNSSYSPVAHGELEDQQFILRRSLIELLEGKRAIPIVVPRQGQDSTETARAD